MAASRNQQPTWDQYERGGFSRTGSVSSFGNRSVQFENESLLGRSVDSRHDDEWPRQLRRRRSSVTNRLAAFTDIGGVNSIRSFTRSWQRAAGFSEVIPQRPSFVFAPDQAPLAPGVAGDVSPYARQHRDPETAASSPSLLRQHLEAAFGAVREHSPHRDGSPEPSAAAHGDAPYHHRSDHDSREGKPLDGDPAQAFRVGSNTTTSGGSIFAIPPHLATPSIVGSYGSVADYGTIRSDVSRASMAQAAALWRQQQEAGGDGADGELPPILVKEVEQDGKIVLAVEGQSTLPQTVFNSTKYVSVGCFVSGLLTDCLVQQRLDRRRPAESAHGHQVRRLDLRHDRPALVRRHDSVDGQAPRKVHGPGPEPHHLLRPRLHLVWPQRPHRHERAVYARAPRGLRGPHRAVRRLARPAVPGGPDSDGLEGLLRLDIDAAEFSAAAAVELHERHRHLLLLHQ